MRKKRVALALVLFAAILGMIVWLARSPDGPVYHGRTARGWLHDFDNWDGNTNSAASVAFREMGSNAIPALLASIQSRGSLMERMIILLNKKQSLVHLPFSEPWHESLAASYALYAMGPKAAPALPVLTNLLFHTNTLTGSTVALSGIGPEALPSLLAALTNQDWRIRHATASNLGWEHSNPDAVVTALVACLQDGHRLVRSAAAISLGFLHTRPDLAVPALTNSLSSNDSLLRLTVMSSLSQFGTNAAQAAPTVKAALNDKDQDVRAAAENALKAIDPEAAAQPESK